MLSSSEKMKNMKPKIPTKIRYLSKPDPKIAKISLEIDRFNARAALGYEENQYSNIGYIAALKNNNIINRSQVNTLKKCHVFAEENADDPDVYIYIDKLGRLTKETYVD